MKVSKLVEELQKFPQDAEVAIHCGEMSSKALGVKMIRRPPKVRGRLAVLRELGVANPMKCKSKKLIGLADEICKSELAARGDWFVRNKAFAEPYCNGADFFETYRLYRDDNVTEAVCIVGSDF